jgi:hypothetical protein
MVMEPVQHGMRDHRVASRRRGREANRHELADPLVSPGLVEVASVLDEGLAQVTLAEHEDVVEALAAHAAQQALTESVRLRRAYRRLQHPRAWSQGGP